MYNSVLVPRELRCMCDRDRAVQFISINKNYQISLCYENKVYRYKLSFDNIN